MKTRRILHSPRHRNLNQIHPLLQHLPNSSRQYNSKILRIFRLRFHNTHIVIKLVERLTQIVIETSDNRRLIFFSSLTNHVRKRRQQHNKIFFDWRKIIVFIGCWAFHIMKKHYKIWIIIVEMRNLTFKIKFHLLNSFFSIKLLILIKTKTQLNQKIENIKWSYSRVLNKSKIFI